MVIKYCFQIQWIIFFNGKTMCKKRKRNVVKYGRAIGYKQLVFRNPNAKDNRCIK